MLDWQHPTITDPDDPHQGPLAHSTGDQFLWEGGCGTVIAFNPATMTYRVYLSDDTIITLSESDLLTWFTPPGHTA